MAIDACEVRSEPKREGIEAGAGVVGMAVCGAVRPGSSGRHSFRMTQRPTTSFPEPMGDTPSMRIPTDPQAT